MTTKLCLDAASTGLGVSVTIPEPSFERTNGLSQLHGRGIATSSVSVAAIAVPPATDTVTVLGLATVPVGVAVNESVIVSPLFICRTLAVYVQVPTVAPKSLLSNLAPEGDTVTDSIRLQHQSICLHVVATIAGTVNTTLTSVASAAL